MVLTKEIGFTREDVRGQTTTVERSETPTGIWPWLQRKLPLVSSPGQIETREIQRTSGMSEEQAIRFLVMHDEHEQMKQDKKEEREETENRKANSRQGLGAGNVPSGASSRF